MPIASRIDNDNAAAVRTNPYFALFCFDDREDAVVLQPRPLAGFVDGMRVDLPGLDDVGSVRSRSYSESASAVAK